MKNNEFNLFPVFPLVRINAFCSAYCGIHPPEYYYSGESHDFWECVFVLKGIAGITAGETVYTLTEGQAIFHPPGEFHRLWNEGNDYLRIAIVSFSAEYFPIKNHKICEFSQDDNAFSVVHNIRKLFITNGIFIKKIRDDCSSADLQKAVNALENLFIELLDKDKNEKAINAKKDKLSSLYSTAVNVMNSNVGKRLSAEEIADMCKMSVSTMQKLFLKYTGMGMMKYYEGIRMKQAHSLLERGYLVKEVAAELGYYDQNYFSTAYKRFFGISPRANKKTFDKI